MRARSLLALGLVLSVTSCSGRAARLPTTLTVGRPTDALRLDPARIIDIESSEVCEQIFEHLVRYRPGSTEIEPALAVSWDIGAEAKTWTFHLRRGVRFHDGTPMDADAVVFSFERQRDVHHPAHEPDFGYWQNAYRNIERVEKIDPLTVRIVIDRPFAPLLSSLAMYPVSIVSPTAARRYGHDFLHHPVGTGPFRFVEWIPGDRITLEANPNYWDGPPKIGYLVFRVIPTERDRLVALESGAVDVAYALAPEDLAYVRLHPDLQLMRVAANSVAFLAINMLHPPFDDLRIRRAINYAVNKPLIVKLLYQSLAIPAIGPLPPGMWGFDASLPRYDYDPDRARALLKEAGYRSELRPRFMVMSTPRPYVPAPERVGRVIARNLAEVGIAVEVSVKPLDQHLAATARGEHDLCLRGWSGDSGDPDNFLFHLLDRTSPSNVAFYRNETVHEWLVAAQQSPDHAERERLYRLAQQQVALDAPWVPIAHAEMAVAARRDVRGLDVHPTAMVFYRHAEVAQSRSTWTGTDGR